jgi:hypothetical protein
MTKEKSITAASALLSSLAAWHIAKKAGKDATPYVMIGGFLGTLIGELIAGSIKKSTPVKPQRLLK